MTLSAARSDRSAVDQRRGFVLPQERHLIWPLVQRTCVHDAGLAVLLWPLAFGQFRLQLVVAKASEPSRPDCKDRIVRELVTYNINKAKAVAGVIVAHEHPKAYCDSVWKLLSGSKNGHLIRLDALLAPEGNEDGI